MASRRSGLIALARIALGLALLAPAAAAEPAPIDDTRAAEADALLADDSGFPRAIELYREVLAEHPDDAELRLRLARVLAWSQDYDASLAEFDQVLAAPEPPASAAVERAEVLSWAGRYAEAEAAFETLLEADPDDARAARGLARVHSWSGRRANAELGYRRALAIESDAEARAELDALLATHRPWLRGEFAYATDSDDFAWLRSGAEAAYWRSAATTLRARAGFHRMSRPRHEAPLAARAEHASDRAADLGLGIEQLFAVPQLVAPLRADLDVGVRLWDHAGTRFTARGRLEASPRASTSIGLEGRAGDLVDENASFEALERGLGFREAAVSLWQGLGTRFDAYGRYGHGWVDGGNRRHAADASLGYRPFATRATRVQLATSWLGYTGRSVYYYDPSSDWGVQVSASDRFALARGLDFAPRAGVGWGRARDGGRRASGVTFETSGELGYAWRLWRLSVFGGHFQSQRGSRYSYDQVLVRVTREFDWR